MNRVLIIGCGDIATRTAKLLNTRYRLFGLARNTERFDKLRAEGITPLYGDLDIRSSLANIAGLANVVLHFAPPLSAVSKVDRKTPPVDSRTRNLLSALARGKLPRRFIYISTSGVYGDCGGARISETHPLKPETARAGLRVDAEKRIRHWANRNGVQASILRVPGIYAEDRLPLERLRSKTPAIAHEEDSYTNHIWADDLARIVVASLRYAKPCRIYHTSDDSEMKMGEYFDAVADAFGMPRPPRLPRAEVKNSASPMMWSFMNESRRLKNIRMKKELKVRLRYPTVAKALQSITLRY